MRYVTLLITAFLYIACDKNTKNLSLEIETEIEEDKQVQNDDCLGESNFYAASHECLRVEGRYAINRQKSLEFNWPGFQLGARFQSSEIGIIIESEAPTYFDITLDGVLMNEYLVQNLDTLRIETDDQIHELKIQQRNESAWYSSKIHGILLASNGTLKALNQALRKIEFIGDSYVVGYGNMSPSKTDSSSQDASGRECSSEELLRYTNSRLAYPSLLAEQLNASYQVNAYSGLGMARHYNGSQDQLPYQDYYKRTLLNQPANYDFTQWHPDIIIIALGTNDFSTPLGENDSGRFNTREELHSAYQTNYSELLSQLRQAHPGVQFLLLSNPFPPENEMVEQVKEVLAQQTKLGFKDIQAFEMPASDNFGCHWHPDKATHLSWSKILKEKVTTQMKW